MINFLNLKNGEVTSNTYRFADAEVTTLEDLVRAYKEDSQECLTASFDEEFFKKTYHEKYKNKDLTNFHKDEISGLVDERLEDIARDLLLEWNDFCDDINELRADFEAEALSQLEIKIK